MTPTHTHLSRALAVIALVGGLWAARPAAAEEVIRIEVTIKDHRFTPAEIRVPSGKPAMLVVHNADATAEEFESSALKIEKVIVAGTSASIRLRPLGPGRYPFVGEYHEETAKGVVISE